MGFQFNHVGGGTKTRRPITLHMKYNSGCIQPQCYLLTEEFGEQDVSLEELQDYIESENARLDLEVSVDGATDVIAFHEDDDLEAIAAAFVDSYDGAASLQPRAAAVDAVLEAMINKVATGGRQDLKRHDDVQRSRA